MKKIVMASAVMAATAMANDFGSRPEASVPTPVETRAALDKTPNLSEKDNADWLKLREERRAAREQILNDLRNKSAAEKMDMRDVAVKPAVAEPPMEKNMEKPKDELVREKQIDERETPKGPYENNPMFPGRMDPRRPFKPHPIERNPWEKPNMNDWNKGPFTR